MQMNELYVFLSGVISAYFGMYISGGISAIAIGLLLMIGISPQIAVTTYLVGSIGGTGGGISKFWSSGNISKKFLPFLLLTAVVAGIIGPMILFKVPAAIMYKVTGLTMVMLLILGVWKKYLGVHEVPKTKNTIRVGYVLNLIIGIWGALFPAGIGVIFYFLYTGVFGMTALQAKGIGKVLGLIWAITLAIGIIWQGEYNIVYIALFIVGSFIGASISSGHVIRSGNSFLRKTILFGITILAIYFIFFAV